MAKSLLIIGAESTGKSSLAHALGAQLGGLVVPERLRLWCIEHGRSPRADEQVQLMGVQIRDQVSALEVCAARQLDWCVLDSGPIMTAAYSEFYFGDTSLWPAAFQTLDSVSAVVWCRPGGVWVADPGMRDGPKTQRQVDALLASRMPPRLTWFNKGSDQTSGPWLDQIRACIPPRIRVEIGCSFHDTKPKFE
jgi:nicotinamide riboside kinase